MQWSWLEKEREEKGVSELVWLLGCVRDEWRIDVCFPFFSFVFPFFFLFFFFFLTWKGVNRGKRERKRKRKKERKEKVHEHDASLQY